MSTPPADDKVPHDDSATGNGPAQADAGADTHTRLRNELEQAQDRTLRVQAEMENQRRRMYREMEDERRYAVLPFAKDLLPVIDNLARAVDSAEQSHDVEGLMTGVKLVLQQLQSVLGRNHVEPIEALHQPFDPNRHEAILQQASADFPEGTVLMVTQPGYQMHDRVVRPSQVIISKPPA